MSLSNEMAEENLHEFFHSLSLDLPEYELVRLGEGAVYYVPSLDWIVRLSRKSNKEIIERCQKEISVSKYLICNGYPTTAINDEITQPIPLTDTTATVWNYIFPDKNSTLNDFDMGLMVKKFHKAMSNYGFQLNKFHLLDRTCDRLNTLLNIDRPDHEQLKELLQRYDDVQEDMNSFISSVGVQPIHGDFHRGNILISKGRAFLHDYEDVCIGPPEWDLVNPLIAHRRFGLDEKAVDDFFSAYGTDLREHPQVDILCRARELFVVVWLIQNRYESPSIDNEVNMRISSLDNPNAKEIWRAL